MEWLWWLGGAFVLAMVELLTMDLIFLMLAGGALVTIIPAALGAPFWAQATVFAVASLLMLGLVRPWTLRHWRKRQPLEETGAAALVGRSAVVVSPVGDVAGGRVKLAGEVWTARTLDPDTQFAVGTDVQVVQIDGATAVVALPGTLPSQH